METDKVDNPGTKTFKQINSLQVGISTADVLRLRKENKLSIRNIAKQLDCSPSTIVHHLRKYPDKKKKIAYFRENRSDLLIYQQNQEYELQELLRKDLFRVDKKTGVPKILTLPPDEKRRWYDTLNTSSGTKFDKEQIIVNIQNNNNSFSLNDLLLDATSHNKQAFTPKQIKNKNCKDSDNKTLKV